MRKVRSESKPPKLDLRKVINSPDLRLPSGIFRLFARFNDLNFARVGIAIKKKDYKLATTRNFIKRKIKGSFINKSSSLPNMDFVILVGCAPNIKNTKFKKELALLWAGCGDSV